MTKHVLTTLRRLIWALAIPGLILLFTACDNNDIAARGKAPSFSEPGVTAKIVDAETTKPVQGAVIYGYYATQAGTLGGGKSQGEQLKSFETETDANGVFTLPAWDTGERKVSGQAMSTFPMLVIYKPGYDMDYDTLKSIAKWRPRSAEAAEPVIKGNAYDWTHAPHLLKPITSERDRYAALNDASIGLMFIGECGWGAYPKTLLVRHNALREWMRRNVPPERTKADGTFKSGFVPPFGITLGSEMLFLPTSVETLLNRYNAEKITWRCSNPNDQFAISN